MQRVERDDAIRYHLTSGTSGRQPLRVLDSRKDWSWIADMWCYGFWGFGIRPTDKVFFAFSYGSFIGFWGAHYCCEKIGSLVIPSGNMTTEQRVKQIAEMKPTVVCATPTYALRMGQCAEQMGIDPVLQMVCRDVTEARTRSEELSYQASHDALTGLVNRRELEKRLARLEDALRR